MYINKTIGDVAEYQEVLINDSVSKLWTSLPGIIESFNKKEMTCTVQPTIKANRFRLDGSVEQVSMPVLLDCPVVFPGNNNFSITFPIKKGDECIVIFSSRCIDNWWYSGKVSPQAEQRSHDLSDGMVIPGIKSIPNVFDNISENSIQIRNKEGNSYIEIKEDGNINLKTDKDVNMKCSKFIIEGDIEVTGSIQANNKYIDDTHKHNNVQSGTDESGEVI